MIIIIVLLSLIVIALLWQVIAVFLIVAVAVCLAPLNFVVLVCRELGLAWIDFTSWCKRTF